MVISKELSSKRSHQKFSSILRNQLTIKIGLKLITLNLLIQSVHGIDRSKTLRKIKLPCKDYFLPENKTVSLKRAISPIPFPLPMTKNLVQPSKSLYSYRLFQWPGSCSISLSPPLGLSGHILYNHPTLHPTHINPEDGSIMSLRNIRSAYKTTWCHKSEHYALKSDLSLMPRIQVHGPQKVNNMKQLQAT